MTWLRAQDGTVVIGGASVVLFEGAEEACGARRAS